MHTPYQMNAINMGIDTHQEPVVYMRDDCHICRAEGFSASSRVRIEYQGEKLTATLNVVDTSKLPAGSIGLSHIAWMRLGVSTNDKVTVTHAPVVDSLGFVRKKINGGILTENEIKGIITDICAHRYSDIEIASFISGCAGNRLELSEIVALTRAMVNCGQHLSWPDQPRIYDKHCIGGLPGNRTTPLVVAIVSAAGLIIPKTSSRAITSPAGTADTLATLTNVDLTLADMKRVVSATGACLAWGGAVNLSPADDLLIRIERALDLDGEGQLVASVLSKKIAAGSTDILIDIPVGATAKVCNRAAAVRLADLFQQVGQALDLSVRCVITDGSCPIGRGIGPVEEARDVLEVFQNKPGASKDLRARALQLASHLLDMATDQGLESAIKEVTRILDTGVALEQFQRIVEAQGGVKALPNADHQETVHASSVSIVKAIDNRRLARLAKLAGAPEDAVAGIRLHKNVGSRVEVGDAVFTVLAASPGALEYALAFYRDNADMFDMG
ncbi:thymidine phosphorylase family protein [Pontibacterium granulatum]|uniref:thymidine phosphorylase family protein n=1 Tax=Pontibacterium granulatum TaxID=2036029 RepID=UPI00249B2C9A|nr:thymidine phosphorylase family protein [Pontibacterium granulatum]MDI3326183.1 thymidine phosphorylase family protein [Pontibacterium granulatum]